MVTREAAAAAEAIVESASAICEQVDHLWDLVGRVSIPTTLLTDKRKPNQTDYETDAVVRALLFADIRSLSQNEIAKRLAARPALLKHLGFEKPPTQQTLSHAWSRRSQIGGMSMLCHIRKRD